MKKLGMVLSGMMLLFILLGCQNRETTEDTTEASMIIENMQKDQENQEKKAIEEKKKRMDTEKEYIEITGEVVETLTKPDSGLDLYRLTVNVHSVNGDVKQNYKEGLNKDYEYFVSPKEFPNINFDQIKAGDTVIIKTFQEAYMTQGEPKQISETDIVDVLVK